jgi:SAM-dependent methyltransferase
VDFFVKIMGLRPGMRVLDLACGYGRHALALARRGYQVVGVDITPCYIEDAKENAAREGLSAAFVLSDIRDVTFESEFDAVLNLADGAVGYLESDEENLKMFDTIARALKPGGGHFLDVMNAEYAERYFPKQGWEIGKQAFAISMFDWLPETRQAVFGGADFVYGQPAQPPEIALGNPTRLYSRAELREIYAARGMEIIDTFSDYSGTPSDQHHIQLMLFARKQEI